MLGRKLTGSASFVCLRCRLQLAGAAQRLPFRPIAVPSSPSRILRRCIGNDAAPSATDEHDSQRDDKSNAEPNDSFYTEANAEPNIEPNGEVEGTPSLYRAHRPLLALRRRLYKSKGGKFLSPQDEGLSIGILGEPGTAIVLREQHPMLQPQERPEPEVQDAPEAKIDISSLLREKANEPSFDDILMNIHELKPEETHLLSDKEFNALKKKLLNGFTSAQLASYITEYQETLQAAQGVEAVKEAPQTPPWALELRPWAPVVENAVEGVSSKLSGYITSRMSPKTKVAIRLMRECWDLSCQGVVEQHGYIISRLPELEFSLLTIGSMRWLEGTTRAVMQNVKEVRLIRESGVVSILATKYAAERILERMDRFLSSARTTEFPIDSVSPTPLEASVLEEVGRATNTITRLDPSGKKVVVTWAHNAERDENFEDTGETVQRFLRDAYGSKPRDSFALETIPADIRQGRYLAELNCGQKLPWQERPKNWARWTAAAPAATQSEAEPTARPKYQIPAIPASILPFAIGSEGSPQESKATEGLMQDWSSEPQIDTSAVFGRVVFNRQGQPPSPSSTSNSASAPDASLPRTFIPLIPVLKSLNFKNNLREHGLWHTNVLVRFVPSLDMSPDLVKSAPNLEISIEADHRELKAVKHLRAITNTHTRDILMPSSHVDTRFIQRRYFTLPGQSIDLLAPPVMAFLDKSDLRPWDGRLNTPPCLLGLRLPRRLFSSNDTTGTDEDQITVNYTLASLEVQRILAAEHEGLKLRYIDTQGGQRGGQRAEISLDAVRVDPGAIPEHGQDSFKIAGIEGERPDASIWPEFTSHSSHDVAADVAEEATAETAAEVPAEVKADAPAEVKDEVKPVDPEEFMKVVADIVNENSRIKWQGW